jgi:hypothetical protein
MDNRFTMADITINKSIPYVRELTNSVSCWDGSVAAWGRC